MYVLSESNEIFDAEMQNFDVKQQLLRCDVRKNLMQIIKSQQGLIPSGIYIYISVYKIILFRLHVFTKK